MDDERMEIMAEDEVLPQQPYRRYFDAPITLEEAEGCIEANLVTAARMYVATGYYLKRIRDDRLYEEGGYKNFEEYVRGKYGKDKGWASKCIRVSQQLSVDGDSPFLDSAYKDYSTYQLVELAYMTEEQRELASPDQTVKQLQEIRRPEKVVMSQPEIAEKAAVEEEHLPRQMEITDFPQYLPASMIHDAEEEVSAAAVFTMNVSEMMTEDELPESQQKSEECCEIAAKPEKTIRWNIGNEYETRRKYCDAAARKFISCFHDWMLEDFCSRVTEVTLSEIEFKREFRKSGSCTWYFNDPEGGAAHVNLFDDYVQFFDGKGQWVGDCEWFYLCASVQSMWNVIALEKAQEAMKEKSSDTLEDSQEPGREAISEAASTEIIDAEFEEIPEETQEVSDYDRRILLDMISDEEETLKEMEDYWKENQPHTLMKHRMKLASYQMLLESHEQEREEPVRVIQPELPAMKNNEQRAAFIDAYAAWPIWIDTKATGERYYRYELPGVALVVKVYYHRCFDYKAFEDWENRWSDGWGNPEYYLILDGKYFKDCLANRSVLIGYLKEIQKKG